MINEIKKIAGKTIINDNLLGTGENAIKLQPSSVASGNNSVAEGYNTISIGNNSHTEGFNTLAGQKGFLINKTNSSAADKKYKLSSVDGLSVNDRVSIAAGNSIDDLYMKNLDFGKITEIDINNSTITVDIYENISRWEVGYLFVKGKNIGDAVIYGTSHAEGIYTKAIGHISHAEGIRTEAVGDGSHAEGISTTAIGDGSHAEGGSTRVLGEYSHVEGRETIASGENQHVEGKFNIEDTNNKYAHIVGNGNDEEYSNAHTLDWEGNAHYAGDVYANTTYDRNGIPTGKKLATVEYVDTINNESFDELCYSGTVESEAASISVTDHLKEKNIINYQIYGNSTQKTRSGKNILPYPYTETTKTENDITFTDNGDGTITINGTASADTTFNLSTDLTLTAETYTFSGCPSGGSDTTYFISGFTGTDVGSGFTITLDSDTTANLSITIKSGTTVSNIVFKPQIEVGLSVTDYEQYGVMPSSEFPSEIKSVGDLVTDTASEYYGKYDIPITMVGKNLLSDYSIVSSKCTIDSSSTKNVYIAKGDDYSPSSFGWSAGEIKLNIKNDCRIGEPITISFYVTLLEQGINNNKIQVLYGDGINYYITESLELNARSRIIKTITPNVKINNIRIRLNSNKLKMEFDTLQIENGSIVTDYEPYIGKVKHIYLNDPLRKKNDYADYIDYKSQTVIRQIEVLDDTGTKTINESFGILLTPIEESITISELISPNSVVMQESVNTTILPSKINLTYYHDIDIKLPTKVSQLINDNGYISEIPSEYIDANIEFNISGYVNSLGNTASMSSFVSTDYIDVVKNGTFVPIKYHVQVLQNICIAFYDKNKRLIKAMGLSHSSFLEEVEGVIEYIEGMKYVRMSSYATYDYYANYCSVKNIIPPSAIESNMIIRHEISKDRLNFSIHDPETNYIDPNNISTGYVNNSGVFKEDSSMYNTGYIKLEENTQYYWYGFYHYYYAFYDADYNVVATSSTALSNPFTIPSGAVYGRFSKTQNFTTADWIYTSETKPKDYAEILDTKVTGAVEKNQGIKNSGKVLIVNSDGIVAPKEQALFETNIYKKGNLLKLEDITNGYIKADGTVQSYNTLWCSGFCEIEQGILYTKEAHPSKYFAFYDENKNVVSTYQNGAMTQYTPHIYTIAVPTNAKYFRCTFQTDPRITTTKYYFVSNTAELPIENDVKSVQNAYPYTLNPSNPCDYQDLTVGVFNKCACIGDSLTYGIFNKSSTSTKNPPSSSELSAKYSYPSQFKKITGVEAVNFGVSGLTSVEWYNSHKDTDFSGYDMAIIHLGVNDGAKDVSDEDTQTALTNIINLLKNSVKNIKIYLCTIIPAYSNIESSTMTSKSALIRTFYNTNYSDDSNVVLLDMEKYGHAKKYTSYCSGHLSALGYYEFARDLARYISWHIDNNLRDYRSIQFIGNDGEYNAD